MSVMTEVEVTHGRDIGDLSIFGRAEKEWLLLPGAVLQTDSVDELDDDAWAGGTPPATRWVLVRAHEE